MRLQLGPNAKSPEATQLENALSTVARTASAKDRSRRKAQTQPTEAKRAALPAAPAVETLTLTEDVVHNGLELRFPPKSHSLEPSHETICAILGENHWRFSKFKDRAYDPRWYIRKSAAAETFAKGLLSLVKVTPPTAPVVVEAVTTIEPSVIPTVPKPKQVGIFQL